MSILTTNLTPDTLLDLAKKTMLLKGVKCQITTPDSCNAILVSWEAYKLHLLRRHTLTVKKLQKDEQTCTVQSQAGVSRTKTRKEWRCAFRCSNRVHTSRESLEQHVDSHMARVPLCCPFQTCENEQPFEGELFLIDHLDSVHFEQRNLPSTALEGQLRASWCSYCQSRDISEPPPWPRNPVGYSDIFNLHLSRPLPPSSPRTPPASPPSRQFPRLVQASALQSPSFNSPGRRPIARQITLESIEDSNKTQEVLEFEDLPVLLPVSRTCLNEDTEKYLSRRSQLPEDWIVWQRPHSWKKETPGPFHLQNPADSNRVPPSSMDYNVFSARVDQLKAEGILGK
ncbi:hypothetical protein FB446DRAFT_850153 [Lentinula raphanica]|nr:hypothetical protein FB446DRAFT_850153 [Lentinula raphanica]